METQNFTQRENLAYAGEAETIHPRLSGHSQIFEKKIYRTAGNIFTAFGWAIESPVFVEGTDGIILIDPCESIGSMTEIMEAFRKISEKPITCVVYTHHHPDHWGGVTACISQEDVDSGKCIVVAQQGFAKGVALMTGILADIKIARSMYMYGYMLPEGAEGRVNLGLGPMMRKDSQGYIAPTQLVDQELSLTVSGIDLEFYHIPSECTDEICIWMPQKKVLHVAECIQGENFPNLYSIRGSNRDPERWIKSIDLMRGMPAEHLVGNHMRPVDGPVECAAHLRDYRDMIQYVHDQTIRLTNQGFTPGNIIKKLEKLPPHLYQRPRMGEHYGTFIQSIRLVYDQAMGWFTGDAAELQPLPPAQAARRYVELIGREKLLEEGRRAIEQEEFNWAAELLTYPIRADHGDMEARRLKAEALRALAYRTENGPFRNWYLTQALNLDGYFEEIKQKMPDMNGPGVYYEAIKQVGPEFIFDCLRVKLNGPRAQDARLGLRILLTDSGFSRDLEIRSGVLEIHEAGTFPVAGTLQLSRQAFDFIFVKLRTIRETAAEGKLEADLPLEQIELFFSYFDGFTPLFDMEFPFE